MDTLLADLIAIPSVTGDRVRSEQAIDFTAAYLRERGMHVKQFSSGGFPSLVATTRDTKKPTVLLAAHLDVVAATPAMFQLRLENGMYYGRGVWDMKFAAALYLHLVDELKNNLASYDFGIMFTTDEESFGQYGTGMLLADEGYRPSVCILPDAIKPWHVQSSAKGSCYGEVTALGISAHGSRPWEGESASFKLIHILEQIIALFKDAQRPDTMTLNIGIIRAGEASFNQIPDSASATLDIRYIDETAFADTWSRITALCEQAGGQAKIIGDLRRPVQSDLRHPLVRRFLRQVQLQHGSLPPSVASNGTSDARFFPQYAIPCILLSPKGGGFHGNDEWLDEADYHTYHQLLREYVEDVARAPHSKPSGELTPVDQQ